MFICELSVDLFQETDSLNLGKMGSLICIRKFVSESTFLFQFKKNLSYIV